MFIHIQVQCTCTGMCTTIMNIQNNLHMAVAGDCKHACLVIK